MNKLKYRQEYIQWFLNFRLKRMRASRLLLKISQNPQLLEQVVFTDDISDKDNALQIAAKGTSAFPFICRIDGMHYSQSLEAYRAMLNLPHDEYIHICLAYPDRPSLPEESVHVNIEADVDGEMVQNLQYIWQHLARQEILNEIDHALDRKDHDEFYRLISKLRRIES
ncbi:YpiB family protein [Metallumcola ferriviriculae]|uniref:YpiB family protein n=1 Tax=Metallumcola ferriviriculae TaxID=3039180 RepID=A0AAU0ULB9_9FIRM|nr:YpiB family protein [Desulfitibacteraceae bacterium MK1]